ncbi:MAG: hypothetical protein J0I19_14145 [Alphaproteobacteria bacterium]|nr:hypothetical protein [Alphaproteobacteria bacterium]
MAYSISSEILGGSRSDVKILGELQFRQRLRSHGLLRAVWRFYRRFRPATRQHLRTEPAVVGNLVIVYRHVFLSEDSRRFPQKSRPLGFDYVKCFQRLIETIDASSNAQRVRVIVMYNGTSAQLASDPFENYLQKCGRNIEVQLIDAHSALASFLVMLRAIRDMPFKPNDIIYFLENDYLHADSWVDEVFRLYSSGLLFDYASLYDHPDRYKYPRNYGRSTIHVTESRHWTTAQSTCGTFIMRHDVFLRDFEYFYTAVHDHVMFTRLTVGMGRKLLTPLPGLAVHCMSEHLDPLQRFEEYFVRDVVIADENG